MANLIKKFQNSCFQNDLFKKGDKILLAVSGGPDSVSMLDIFSRLQKKYSLDLIIAHVNYNLRGKDSKKDEEFVRELAEKYGMEISVLTLDPSVASRHLPLLKKSGNATSENELRNIRYAFFEKLRKKKKLDAIAVAHNLDDQVETFLMRIIRGSGISGLSAMKFKNNFLIRPLLSISRKEIVSYLKNNKLRYRMDKTNLENKYLRNKIRNKLLPNIEKNYNPKIKRTIFDSLISISQDLDFLEKENEKILKKNKGLEIKKLEKLHPAMLRRVLRKAIEERKGDLKNISMRNIEEIIKIIKSTKNKNQIVILSGLKITRKKDIIVISKL